MVYEGISTSTGFRPAEQAAAKAKPKPYSSGGPGNRTDSDGSRARPSGSPQNNNPSDNSRSAHSQEILDAYAAHKAGNNPYANSRHGVGYSGQQSQVDRHNKSREAARKTTEIYQAVQIAEHQDIEKRYDAIHDNIPHQAQYGQPRLDPSDHTKIKWVDVPVYPVSPKISNPFAVHDLVTDVKQSVQAAAAVLPTLPLDPKFRQPIHQQQPPQKSGPSISAAPIQPNYSTIPTGPKPPEFQGPQNKGVPDQSPIQFYNPADDKIYTVGKTTYTESKQQRSLLDPNAEHAIYGTGSPNAQFLAGILDHPRELYLSGKSLHHTLTGKEDIPLSPDDPYRPTVEGLAISDLIAHPISWATGQDPPTKSEAAQKVNELMQTREGQSYLAGSILTSAALALLPVGGALAIAGKITAKAASTTLRQATAIGKSLSKPAAKVGDPLEYSIARSQVDEIGAGHIRKTNNAQTPFTVDVTGPKSAVITVGTESTPDHLQHLINFNRNNKSAMSSVFRQTKDQSYIIGKDDKIFIHGQTPQQLTKLTGAKKVTDHITSFPNTKNNLEIVGNYNKELAHVGTSTTIKTASLVDDPVMHVSDIKADYFHRGSPIYETKAEKYVKGYLPGEATSKLAKTEFKGRPLDFSDSATTKTPDIPGPLKPGSQTTTPQHTPSPNFSTVAKSIAKSQAPQSLPSAQAAGGFSAAAITTVLQSAKAHATQTPQQQAPSSKNITNSVTVPKSQVRTNQAVIQGNQIFSSQDIKSKSGQQTIPTTINPFASSQRNKLDTGTGTDSRIKPIQIPITQNRQHTGGGTVVIPKTITQTGTVTTVIPKQDQVFRQKIVPRTTQVTDLVDIPRRPPPTKTQIPKIPVIPVFNFSYHESPHTPNRKKKKEKKIKSGYVGNVPFRQVVGIHRKGSDITEGRKQIKQRSNILSDIKKPTSKKTRKKSSSKKLKKSNFGF